MKKIIKKRHELALLIADVQKRNMWKELLFSIALVFRLCRALGLNENGLVKLEEACKNIIYLFIVRFLIFLF